MTVTAGVLLLISAITHAGWNFISKQQYPTMAFLGVANTIGVICFLPVVFILREKIPLIPLEVWGFAIVSGFFLAANFVAIAGAYQAGDMSIAYPIARSLPVIFVFAATTLAGTGTSVGSLVWGGVFLVVAGCFMLPLKRFSEFHYQRYLNWCCLLAFFSAVAIACYTLSDDAALRHFRGLTENPFHPLEATLLYLIIEGIFCSLWNGVYVAFNARERMHVRQVLSTYKAPAIVTGLSIYFTYGLVLAAMNFVTNVGYVAAFRQLSIPVGAFMGLVFLKEAGHVPKLIGVGLIFMGLLMVGFG